MWEYIGKVDKIDIVRDFGDVEKKIEILNELIEKYDLVEYKYTEDTWGLSYPLIDHCIMFRSRSGEEYLASNAYIATDDVQNTAEKHPELCLKIEGPKYSFYKPNGTTLIMISKR